MHTQNPQQQTEIFVEEGFMHQNMWMVDDDNGFSPPETFKTLDQQQNVL